MDKCSEILKKIEIDKQKINDQLFEAVLEDFCQEINMEFNFIDCHTPWQKVRSLMDVYIYSSPYADFFFDKILRKYNYNMKQEIRETISELGFLEDPNTNRDIINNLLGSPIIQDISYDGEGTFTIISEQYGIYKFTLASVIYNRNNKIRKYIQQNTLQNNCHMNTYFIAGVLPDAYSITSLCPYYFIGKNYHSYTFDGKANTITDLCCNLVMEKDMYYQLYEPEEISVILNSNVKKELGLVKKKTSQPKKRFELLQIALYKQYLASINYRGSLENAPSIKEKIYRK